MVNNGGKITEKQQTHRDSNDTAFELCHFRIGVFLSLLLSLSSYLQTKLHLKREFVYTMNIWIEFGVPLSCVWFQEENCIFQHLNSCLSSFFCLHIHSIDSIRVIDIAFVVTCFRWCISIAIVFAIAFILARFQLYTLVFEFKSTFANTILCIYFEFLVFSIVFIRM